MASDKICNNKSFGDKRKQRWAELSNYFKSFVITNFMELHFDLFYFSDML